MGTPSGDRIPEPLRSALASRSNRLANFGTPLVYYDEIGSTNDLAAQLAGNGAPDGTLVVAGAQTHGRGRRGREWFSPQGAGLYFSLVVRPAQGAADHTGASLLTLIAGVAVVEAIERCCGLSADLKWPNDLVIERGEAAVDRGNTSLDRAPTQRRKLAGILAEGTIAGGAMQHIVLGIGINLLDSAYPEDLKDRVTSLTREVGRDVDGWSVLAECVATFAERWSQARAGRSADVLEEWRRRSPSARGAPVLVPAGCSLVRGLTAGLRDDGALMVDVRGTIVPVIAGEVRWL